MWIVKSKSVKSEKNNLISFALIWGALKTQNAWQKHSFFGSLKEAFNISIIFLVEKKLFYFSPAIRFFLGAVSGRGDSARQLCQNI